MGITERKAREKEQRREDIINAAEKVFFSKGFEHCTMDDIAEESELAKGTLYLYFKGKEELHLAVARRAINLMNEMTEPIRELGVTAIEKLVALGRAYVEFARKYPDYLKSLLFMESLDSKKLSVSKQELKEVIYRETPVRLVMEFVQDGVRDHTIRKDIPPEIIANTLWSQMLGVIQFALVKKGIFELVDFSPEELFENHIEIALNGIHS